MNPRRRTVTDPVLPGRVYPKSGSWYWYPKGGSWIKLCRIDEGEAKMLERLAAEKRKHASMTGIGNVPPLVAEYVKQKRSERRERGWHLFGDYVKKAFSNHDIEELDTAYVAEFLRANYGDKLHMQRRMRSFLTGFFQWCRENRHYAGENPCNGIRIKQPKPRDVYITDDHFMKIREDLAKSSPMILCLVDLCYLTAQRSTEIRSLRWKKEDENTSWVDRENGVIHFRPSKTRDSSGLAVDWPITPEIDAVLTMAKGLGKVKGPLVIHTKSGGFWRDTIALRVWREACNRLGLQQHSYTIKDIRAKALTDAKRAGYETDALMVAAAHSNKSTTETYFKERSVPLSNVRLAIPKSA